MGINIRTNIESVNAQRRLSETSSRLQTSYSRLSSGLRITKAADDAAGLAIAEQLRTDGRIAQVAIRNANDGISIIAIADGAMSQLTNILVRMTELAEQSANGVYGGYQRSALQNEFNALGSEIDRIAKSTEFNGLKLLSGGQQVNFQIGFDGLANSQVTYSSVQATLESIGLAAPGSSALIYSISDNTNDAAALAARSSIDALKTAINAMTQARGTLGAAESRLNITIENLMIARENINAAESRIRDVDVASEAAELTRLNILQQAATSVLAQANQQPQLALQLLQR